MNYIYDIYLNFNKKNYDFYEWKETDKIERIRKIPIFIVDEKIIESILSSEVKLNLDFLEEIKNKTEKYNFEKIEYSCILLNKKTVIAISMNSDGLIKEKSKLQLNDEYELLEYYNKNKIKNIDYEIIRKNNITFFTRMEMKIKKYILTEVESAYQNKNLPELQYLYYELFDKKDNDISKMKRKIIDSMKIELNNKHFELYKVLELMNENKVKETT